MADDVARWAAGRAPDLIERAEAEAVAILRDALLDAARRRTGVAQPNEAAVRVPAQDGELIWAYCAMRAGTAAPVTTTGVAGRPVERLDDGELAVLVSRVPAQQFAEAPLRDNLNDLLWLEDVARAHQGVLDDAFAATTIVPLRLCTLYDDEDSARAMLGRERAAIEEALERLAGRQEWAVKVLVDDERLQAAALAASPVLETREAELAARSEGSAYLERRRVERRVREQADSLAAEVADRVHARLQDWAITHPPQNRELSGHDGEMLLNGAYLVESDRAEGLRDLVAELEAHHRDVGARIELTGPWPPFNFVDATRS
jgi:hypothetical protein